MNNPIATYRLQFQKEFNFQQFEEIIPYLQQLGVSTIYASPIFKSTPGSTHGYDGVNPNEINPEIGTQEKLLELSNTLKSNHMNWLQDIVPNHMAFHSENPWLMDVLEKGMQSVYAPFFDIAWNSRLYHGKLMVPFLGSDLEALLENKKITIVFDSNRFVLKYEEWLFPLNPRSYTTILDFEDIKENQSLEQILAQINEINEVEDARMFSQRWNELLLQLASLSNNEPIKDLIEKRLSEINTNAEKLKLVLDQQTYVLCHWQTTEHEINYRRFFTVNGLICLNIQNEEVFNEYHALIKSLVDQGIFQGVRIDHIDGLYDPAMYLEQIRELAGKDAYIVVEKILENNESLPAAWPVEGTTGYEFLSFVNNLLTSKESEQKFTDFYQELTGENEQVQKQLLGKKAYILYEQMGGELENLYQLYAELSLTDKEKLEVTGKDNVKKAIGELLIHCPVYRYYGNRFPLENEEINALKNIFKDVTANHPGLSDAINLLEHSLLVRPADGESEYNEKALEFYQRCMQFSGPLMAKGGEDTLMYTYERFAGHNDVGDSPENFGITKDEFHKKMKQRQKDWPYSLNTTSTHDTKRGEDVRARLNVLTDLPDLWFSKVREWQELNASLREELSAPDSNDEYLIYQMLLGAYPMPGEDEDDFSARFDDFLQKALREGKVNSSWATPNETYESGTKKFARQLLDKQGPFWKSFSMFHQQIADYGIINSLSQLLLKFTCPGIPDVYQGCELWDFSLVDPDNRRPVDFGKRQQQLEKLENEKEDENFSENLWESRNDARIKLFLTKQLFDLRKENPVLFSKGDYIPLKVKGIYRNNVLAFGRTYKETFMVVAVPLHSAAMCKEQETGFFNLDWKDTKIVFPPGLNIEWEDIMTGEKDEYLPNLSPADLFKKLPVAVLKGSKIVNERSAGILVHITSLTSPFGIGDMGPEAHAFADFLSRSNQKIWQLLPLNPTEAAQGNSPYSALSSRAGNPVLISPEILAKDGLLENVNLQEHFLPQDGKADFEKAEKIKMELLEKAYITFSGNTDSFPTVEFDAFCSDNKEWLEDFSLYMVLKNQYNSRPWFEWEQPVKLRNEDALKDIQEREPDKIRFVKWVQYIFDKQWKSLRQYCNKLNIKLLGDMPFYVSYDSADVWAHRNLFLLDEEGKMTGIAGVPPDAFSEDGQLWGMPVFNWETLKEQQYQWWISRLRKNVELFDLVRLDHFRAFADYWVVPGGEKTAVNGEWKLGPDADFFKAVETALGGLPFVAEDLGEQSPAVGRLRDEFKLPGMKVLQFAFEENMPQSDYIPHNYTPNFIGYTGTHDNNTIRGWFRQDIDADMRGRVEEYVGRALDENDIYWVMAVLIYSSVAKTAILPIQDVLNLDETCKMNIPGSNSNNWVWRLLPGQLTQDAENKLRKWTVLYNRD